MSQKTKNDQKKQTQMLIIGVIAAVVVVAGAAIIFSASGASAVNSEDFYADIPQARTDDGAFVLGNPDAPVTIVAFEDFLCPACQSYQGEIKKFIEDSVATGEAKFEYRMFPAVDPTFSALTASLAECADEIEPGAFWAAHDELFRLAGSMSRSDLPREFANRMGFEYGDVLDCTANANQWLTDQAVGRNNDVNATPTIRVRIGDGPLQNSPLGQRPNAGQLNSFVDAYQG